MKQNHSVKAAKDSYGEASRVPLDALARAYSGAGHPWADFLHHRRLALRYLSKEEHATPEELAETLSMDAGQVRLILMSEDQQWGASAKAR